MFCPKCGKINPDDGELCSGCGAVLHEPKPETPAKKKGRAGKIIALIAAAAVAVGGTAAAVVSCERDSVPVYAETCFVTII